jgi:simple sugar transport system substrate-binding protein
MDEFLKAERRRIHVLFAHSDTMALGAVEAIESAGLVPGSDILVISIEGSRQGLEAVLQGKINVTVECSPLLGPQLMATAREVVAGRPVSRHIVTPEAVFTRENAAAALPGRRY